MPVMDINAFAFGHVAELAAIKSEPCASTIFKPRYFILNRIRLVTEVEHETVDAAGWVACGKAVQNKVGAEGADGHRLVGVVDLVVCSEVEYGLVLAADDEGREGAAESDHALCAAIGVGCLKDTGVVDKIYVLELGVDNVVTGGGVPLHDVCLASFDVGHRLAEIQCQRSVAERSCFERFHHSPFERSTLDVVQFERQAERCGL